VGAMLKHLVRNERPVINSEQELWTALSSAHTTLQGSQHRQFFINLVESMPNRLAEVIGAAGGHTSY